MASDLTLSSAPDHISVITSREGVVKENLTPTVFELNHTNFLDFVSPAQRAFFQSLLKTTQVVQHNIELFLLCPPPTPYLFSVTPASLTGRLLLVGYLTPEGAHQGAFFDVAGMHQLKGFFAQHEALDGKSPPDAQLREELRQQMLALGKEGRLSPFLARRKSPIGETAPFNLSRIVSSFNTGYARRCEREEKNYVPANITDSLAVTTLVGDRASLEKILDNLLSNAVKYTNPYGEVRFSVSVEAAPSLDREESVSITFLVTDTGKGISEEYRDRVFSFGDRLAYGEGRANSPHIEGQGVGLADSKTTADLLDWTLGFKANDGGPGTTFYLTAAFKTTPPIPELSEAPLIRRNIRVLVVEDAAPLLKVITRILKKSGIESITTPQSMEESLAACQDPSLDLIITDRQLWEETRGGDQVVQRRRHFEKEHNIRRIPCILSSADTVSPEELRTMGGTGVLPKPYRLAEITALLDRFFPIGEQGTTLQLGELPLQEPLFPERGASL